MFVKTNRNSSHYCSRSRCAETFDTSLESISSPGKNFSTNHTLFDGNGIYETPYRNQNSIATCLPEINPLPTIRCLPIQERRKQA